ncbi:hypothetical protein ACHAXS_006069 [Conticribra weissflogii]
MSLQFYSPLKGDDGAKGFPGLQQFGGSSETPMTKMKSSPKRNETLSHTPRKTIGNASSSISRAVSASANHASKKIKSFVPQKLRIMRCLTKNNDRNTNATESRDEDDVPMIFYVDNDMTSEETVEFLDPFAFEEWAINSHEDDNYHASSTPGAFSPNDDENSPKMEGVLFDCPFPSSNLKFDDNTSLDVCMTIRSINARNHQKKSA